MNKENNMELKSEYVEVEVLGYGLPLYNAIGSSGDKVIYEGIEYDSTMIVNWLQYNTNWRTMLQSALHIKPSR